MTATIGGNDCRQRLATIGRTRRSRGTPPVVGVVLLPPRTMSFWWGTSSRLRLRLRFRTRTRTRNVCTRRRGKCARTATPEQPAGSGEQPGCRRRHRWRMPAPPPGVRWCWHFHRPSVPRRQGDGRRRRGAAPISETSPLAKKRWGVRKYE